MKLRRPLVLLAVLPILCAFIVLEGSPPLKSQSTTSQAATEPPTPQWQTDAGGKITFDAASVKLSKSGNPQYANFPLDAGDAYPASGGYLS